MEHYHRLHVTFEFISLRDWLIFIGCPRSLIYRISWSFYWRFEYTFTSMSDYQLEMRRFVFGELRGLVSEYDFGQLEIALFGDGFGFVLQRMWAFRGFRLAQINRSMCEGWFNFYQAICQDSVYQSNWRRCLRHFKWC